jgi:hypothetical protein
MNEAVHFSVTFDREALWEMDSKANEQDMALQGSSTPAPASSPYSSILRPTSISAREGILNRSMACAELRDMNENSATGHRHSGFRFLRLTGSLRSM